MNDDVIVLRGVRKEYGDLVAVESADLAIGRGEFFSLLGPSGCGKTTLLRMIAGFEVPSRGQVLLEGEDVSSVPPHERNVNTVFQHYALFPHMSVLDNVAFGLRAKKVPEKEALRRAREMLGVVRLKELGGRRPSQLSGGQQQRVALARALVNLPSALLLDEPLAALDLKLREAMQIELKRIQREVGITFVFVTHDQHEALTMSDRIAVMSRGRVEQVGTPHGIYGKPSSIFVAGFIGSANLLPGTVGSTNGNGRSEVVLDGGARLEVESTHGLSEGAEATVLIRPERLRVFTAEAPAGRSLRGTIEDVIFQGQDVRMIVHLGDGTEVIATVDADDELPTLERGAAIALGWAADAPLVLEGRSAIVGATTTDLDEVQASLEGKEPGFGGDVAEASEGTLKRVGRRAFLYGAGLAGAAAVVAGVVAVTGSGEDDGGAVDREPTGRGTLGTGSRELRILNWQAYIDPTGDGSPGTLDRFIEATGIDVTYDEGLNDNREFFAREIEPYLGTGARASFDIVCPTYWIAARMKSLGWAEPLPVDRIPNRVNLEERYLNQPWDYGAVYSLPWQAGITGIAYNPELTGRELRSVMDLYDPRFKGRIGMLTELNDSVGLTMLGLGRDPSRVDEDGAMEAMELLARANAEGQFRAFTGNEYVRSLESGDFVACLAWSGDVLQLQYSRPEIQFVVPEEGGISFYDTMVIPKGALNGHAAAAWMNFVYDPVQAAHITRYVQFLSPVKGVRDELVKLGDDAARLAESPILFPSDEVAARLTVFAALPPDVEARLNDRFLEIVGR